MDCPVTVEEKKMLVNLGYVEFDDNTRMQGHWKCKKCGHGGEGRPNRIMAHFLCIKNRGVRICSYMECHPDERVGLAQRLRRNLPPEQNVFPTDEMFRTGVSLEDNNDGTEETNAMIAGMINATHQGQSSRPDSTQPSFPRGGMEPSLYGPVYTPEHVTFYHMWNGCILPSRDGAPVDPPMAASSMDIEGQQQLQPGEEGNIVNNMGDTENTSSRAVLSNFCANRQDRSNVPDLGSAGREGGASPDVRRQNAVSQEKESKKRKCAPGSGTTATASQLDDSEHSSPFSVSDCISTPPENLDSSMPVLQDTNSGAVQGTNDLDFEPNNTVHQGTGEEGRENGIDRVMSGTVSCQPQASTPSAQHLRFTSDTVQPTDRQDVAGASITNLYQIEAMLREIVKEHFQTTLASGSGQQEFHGSTLSSQNQLSTDTEPSAPSQVRSSMQSTRNCNLIDSGPSQGTEDFASLADRFRELAQTEVDARRDLVQNMIYLVRGLQTLNSEQADLKTQLEEKESVTVRKRKQQVNNWLRQVDQVKEEVVEEINHKFEVFSSFHGSSSVNSPPVLFLIKDRVMIFSLSQIREQNFLEGTFSLEDLKQNILRAISFLKDLKGMNDRILKLGKVVDELLKERKLLLEPTVDVVLQKKYAKGHSELQHFVEEHFKLIFEMTGHGVKCRS